VIELITFDQHGAFSDHLVEMHRLRYRVFKQRLDWDVETSGDMEMDEFDALHPAYLVQLCTTGEVEGCVRLLPTTGPTMIRERFPALLGGSECPSDPAVWESSRFALDVPAEAPKSPIGLARATHELFAGMIEFGLWCRLVKIVTVTDVRMERILRRAGWPLERIGGPRAIGTTLAVAGFLEVSTESLSSVRAVGGISRPVLWLPALAAAA
jgi:acyl homoserine lactone synthase